MHPAHSQQQVSRAQGELLLVALINTQTLIPISDRTQRKAMAMVLSSKLGDKYNDFNT